MDKDDDIFSYFFPTTNDCLEWKKSYENKKKFCVNKKRFEKLFKIHKKAADFFEKEREKYELMYEIELTTGRIKYGIYVLLPYDFWEEIKEFGFEEVKRDFEIEYTITQKGKTWIKDILPSYSDIDWDEAYITNLSIKKGEKSLYFEKNPEFPEYSGKISKNHIKLCKDMAVELNYAFDFHFFMIYKEDKKLNKVYYPPIGADFTKSRIKSKDFIINYDYLDFGDVKASCKKKAILTRKTKS